MVWGHIHALGPKHICTLPPYLISSLTPGEFYLVQLETSISRYRHDVSMILYQRLLHRTAPTPVYCRQSRWQMDFIKTSSFYCIIHCESKNIPLYFCLQLRQMLTDFQNSFTDRLSGKFAIRSLWNIAPHLRCVTTLPCEIFMFRNCLFFTQKHVIKTSSCNSFVQNYLLILTTPVWYLSILVSRLMGPTIVTCCCYNSCYQPYVRCPASSSSFSRTVGRHTVCVRQSVFWNVRHLRLSR